MALLGRSSSWFWNLDCAAALSEVGATEATPAAFTTTLTNVGSLAPANVIRPM